MIHKIPMMDIKEKLSAIFSSFSSFFMFCALIDKNEKITDMLSKKVTAEVNSFIRVFSKVLFI